MIDVGIPVSQAAPPHGTEVLGHGPRKHSQAGCFHACWVMAMRALTGNRSLTVLEVHARILAADGFSGSGLRRQRAAKALGLELADPDGSEPFDPDVARAELDAGRPVIVGVDYRPGRSSGFSDSDHFMLLVGHGKDGFTAVDPASGRKITIRDPAHFAYKGNEDADLVEMCRLRAAPL